MCVRAGQATTTAAGPAIKFVRIGTLDAPDHLPPDIHIFTVSRQPWIVRPPGVPSVPENYKRESYWPSDSLARRRALAASYPPAVENDADEAG